MPVALRYLSISTPQLWMDPCGQSYLLVRTWTATDPCGNSATAQQTVTVSDNNPPVISSMPMDITVTCGNVPDPNMVTASDACDPNPTVNYTETVEGQFCDPQVITRTWRAEDDCGNFSVVVQKIYVTDDSPQR